MEEFLRRAYILGIVAVLFIFTASMDPALTGLTTFYSQGTSEIVVWDITDNYYTGPYTKYTRPTDVHSECLKFDSVWTIYFYANYTNTTGDSINSSGDICRIRHDRNDDSDYGDAGEGWVNMSFNSTSFLWENYTNLTYDGMLDFEVNCTSATYTDINVTDNVTINNTGPCIFGRQGGLSTNPLPDITCYEDTICNYDFKENCTDDDQNDIASLVYTYAVDPAYTSYFSMASGVLQVDMTDNSNSEEITVDLNVEDKETMTSTSMNVTVNPVNDAPVLSTLPSEATEDVLFDQVSNPEGLITATDEEDNTPFKFNLTFLSCQKAHWIEYPTDNCSVFNFTLYSVNMTIEDFIPTNWDVGTYQINFSVEDSGAQYPQFNYNSTSYSVTWFNVTNVNDMPSITPINSTSVTVDQGDYLHLVYNGTDIENDTLVFNSTTMLWNGTTKTYSIFSNSSLFPVETNSTYYPNVSAHGTIESILGNSHVGNYTLNITVTDNGTNPENLTGYIYVNLSVMNVNDPPELVDIPETLPYGIQETPYYYYYNATDPDFDTIYGETLTFGMNFTFCETPNGTECDIDTNSTFSVTKVNDNRSMLYIYAVRNDTGNYTINLTVSDSGGIINYTLVNITIVTDEAPVFDAVTSLSSTQGQPLLYEFNVSDPENNEITFENFTLYRNLTETDTMLFYATNDSSGYPPYVNLTINFTNLTNSQVGNYTFEINATDYWNRTTTHRINISVANLNDPPVINNFTSCDGSIHYGLNMTLYEDVYYCLKLYRPDPDLYVPEYTYNETVKYQLTSPSSCDSSVDYYPSGNCSGLGVIDMDYDTGEMIFTAPSESWHGNYTYNLTINDSSGIYVSKMFNFSLLPVNDPPVLHNMTDFLNLTADDNFLYQINATDEENNYPFNYSVVFTCDGSPCSLFQIDNDTGLVNYTLQMSDIGDYTANFTVTDNGNATFGYSNSTGWNVTNITVNIAFHDPQITLLSAASFDMTEGTVKDFFYRAFDNVDNDTLTCYWYINGTLIQPDSTLAQQAVNPVSDCNSTEFSSELWQYPVTYVDALNLTVGTANITLVVVDEQGRTDSESVIMNVNGSNRAPTLNQSLQSPVKWYNDMSIEAFQLNDYFIDDYGEELNFTSDSGGNVAIGIQSDGNVTFSPASGWYGTSWVVFYAYDWPYNASSIFNASSNNVTLIVQYQEPIEVEIPRSVYRSKIASMQIIVDEIIRIPAQNTSFASVSFYNDGSYELHDINISAIINETNITLSLMDTYIEKLALMENFTTIMNISIGDLDEGQTYTGYVHADVRNPRLHERTAFTIKITPSNSTKVIIQIVMVKDLFEENPECMELFSLIVEAESALDKGNIDRARELTQLAMDNCQDMIDYAKLYKNETISPFPSVSGQIFMNPFFVMGFVIALIVLAMLGYWFMSRRFKVEAQAKTLATEE